MKTTDDPSFSTVLVHELQKAHLHAAQRENISTVTFLNALAGSGSYIQAVTSALLTTGGAHAPVEDIVNVLEGGLQFATEGYLDAGKRVPGWGNSFIEGPDESLDEVFSLIEAEAPDLIDTVSTITEALHGAGKYVYPNIGCATAAASIVLDMPTQLAPHLFVICRVPAWYGIALSQENDD